MTNQYLTDEALNALIQASSTAITAELVEEIDTLERQFPADERIHYLRYAVRQAAGLHRAALDDLWSCLEIKPNEAIVLDAIADTVLQRGEGGQVTNHNLSLKSGERQVAEDLEKIRADHVVRYKLAASLLGDSHENLTALTGLDLFCGNGYGSRLVHNVTGSRLIGIDGSSDAVAQANRAYGNHRVKFFQKYFPFSITPGLFDFAICFESVEHVDDYKGLLDQVFEATKGHVFLSVPAEETLNFEANKSFFKFHVRHFTLPQIRDLCSRYTQHTLKNVYGQTVYKLKDGVVSGLVAADKMYIRPTYSDSQFHLLHFAPR